MVLKNSGIIFIFVCAIAVIIAIVIVALPNENEADADDIKMGGQWYATDIEIMDLNETTWEYDLEDEKIVVFDVFIYDEDKGVVNGFFYDRLFAGAYSHNILISDIYDEINGIQYHIKAFFSSNDSMQMVATAYYDDRSHGYALSGLYERERVQNYLEKTPDVKDTWYCNYSKYMDVDGVHEISDGGVVVITSQNNAVFSGQIEMLIDKEVSVAFIVGGFNRDVSNGYMAGIEIDSNGHYWNIYSDGKCVILNACTPTNEVSDEERIISSLRVCSKDGSTLTGDIPIELEGTEWRGTSAEFVDQNGNYEKTGMLFTINFIEQTDALVRGTLVSGSTIHDFVGYICSNNPIAINIITTDETCRYGEIITDDDGTFDFLCDNIISNVSTSTRITYELQHDSKMYDVVGHWYNVYTEGYDENNNYKILEKDIMHYYDLDIYGVKDNMFYGFFDGSYISGSIENNKLSFRCEVDGGYIQFDGTLISSGYLIVALKHYDYETSEFSIWNDFFSLDILDSAQIPNYDIDIAGKWNSISAISFSDIEYQLVGTKLNIENYTGNIFIGTMEQENHDKQVVNRVMKGAVEEYYIDDDGKVTVIGTMVGEMGFYWKFILYDDEYLILHSTKISEVSDREGKLVSTERIYTRDGTGSVPDMDYVDIQGTEWELTDMHVMAPGGEYYEQRIDYTIEYTDTERTLFYGWSNYDGYPGGQVAGFMKDSDFYIGSLYGGEAVLDSGYGWIYADTVTMIEFYIIENEWCTVSSTFVRTK